MTLPTSPHRRYNPLTREWVLVSPHRSQRPWLGQVEKTPQQHLPAYDPTCYLCPGNARAGGAQNPAYTSTFVFDNDFASLLPAGERGEGGAGEIESPTPPRALSPLLIADPTPGLCRVVCFSPRHDLTLPELSLPQVEAVVKTWTEQTSDLAAHDFIHYVQVFENKGEIMGCSNPHPHSQIWASAHIPNEPAKELSAQQHYYAEHDQPLLLDYLEEERKQGSRIVIANDYFTALVPFWAIWPFETIVIAHRAVPSLPQLTSTEQTALAEIFRRLTIRYDNLFDVSFPYSMGFHQAPFDGEAHPEGAHPEWVLHAHFYPPLLRSATVKKFMVGYELMAMPQRDLTPEAAAERLRGLSEVHYKSREGVAS